MPADDASAHFALFDADDGGALLLSGFRRALDCPPGGDPAVILAAIEAARCAGDWVAVAADYALGTAFEPSAPSRADPAAPPLRAWVFARSERLDAAGLERFLAGRCAALSEAGRVAGVAEVRPGLSPTAHAEAVQRIRQWIADGDCYQINYTFPLDFRYFGAPLALYRALRARQPVRYGAFLSLPGATFVSLSPELFFERRGALVRTRPMKGTAPRGATPAADARQRESLLNSAKERAENVMIVDLLRNDLGRLAPPGKVGVETLCEAEAYPTLWQMVSSVVAELPDAPLSELFRVLFPCGSITGAPKIRAMQRIAELEDWSRGIYTGALGWVSPTGDCRFNVAIRTFAVDTCGAEGQARLGVGSGIVIDADPAREYDECLLKASFLTGFDPGFALIETLRLDGGRYPRLPLHLERLRASARALGFACDMAAISTALAGEASRHGAGVFRVRLTLAHDGALTLDSAPLPVSDGEHWGAVIADEVLDPAGDYLRRYKTTARSGYDRALAALPPGVFDAIFLNARGEVCEGARSNVFVERDGRLLTPPLSCGLLPGVLRRELIDAGCAVECSLTRSDLLRAERLYLGNALRGLVAVNLVS